MREFSKDLNSTIIYSNSNKKRCKTVNGKRKNSESNQNPDQVIVGKYKYFTDSLLGEGYSSKVYKGIQIDKPQKRFAVKVIQLRKFQQATLKLLEQEIVIHRNLKHQNIVECYQAIKTKNYYYLILEYCPHGSLEDLIQRKKKISLPVACEIMDQISKGYKYLLANNIIHRDIKPANILKFQNTWKIADFGFAVRKSLSFVSQMNVGTPLYMPIQSLMKSQYSFKSDIFALGVTFYHMIHGQTPWTSRTQEELIESMKKQPLFISNFISNEQIKNFFKKACAIDHKHRMSHQEFQKITFLNFIQRSSPNSFKQKIVFRAISPRKNSLQTEASMNAFASKKSNQTDLIRQQGISQNQIKAQITISKHIYSIIANIDSFLLDQKSKQFFWMALFKFLVRFVHETERKSQSIKNNKNLYNQIKQLALKYEKQYLDYLKHLQVKVIREVNTKFYQLCHKNPFSKGFYKKMEQYLVQILKQVDKNILQLLKNKQKSIVSKDKIQAFRALKKLYEHCSDNKNMENSQCVKNIEVIVDFKGVQKNNENEYQNMRKVLINV